MISGRMMCTNNCNVRIHFKSICINPMDFTTMQFVISGRGLHSDDSVKTRRLQGAARITEVACGMGTVHL